MATPGRQWRSCCGLGAARGEGEREAMGQAGAFGQALALFWSADARRGDLGSA